MSSIVEAGENSQQHIPFINPGVTAQTNIHNNASYCAECHVRIPVKGGDTALRFADYSQTCRCHGYSPGSYRHPLGMELSPEERTSIPPLFPLEENRLTCGTCHAVVQQCGTGAESRVRNDNFLRISSRQSRTALCYACHDKNKYRRLNPHKQLDDAGNILMDKCLYCHKFKPDEQQATLKKQRAGAEGTVEFVDEFFRLCFRCHYKQTAGHLINANHLTREPPEKILANMRVSEKELDIILPLDDEGGLTCATCHNPHQRGIIPFASPAAKGADENKRLRVPKEGNRICRACHRDH